ncbi:MAG: DNA repair protein RecO [Thermaurantimonas sp.]
MFSHTRLKAIYLSSAKSTNGSLILNMFTDEMGKEGFITKNIRGKNSVVKASYLMPLNVLDIVADARQNRTLHFIAEAKPAYIPTSLMANPIKRAVSFFVAEILHRCMHHHQPVKPVFQLMTQWIELYDKAEESTGIYVHWLLAHLIRQLGIEPLMMPGPLWLDLREGKTTPDEPCHEDKLRPEITSQVYQLFHQAGLYKPEVCGRMAKPEVLDALLQYLRLHIPGFGVPKTLSVIKEIFD